jgi:tetratricopeptide (TPR) repeat protein
MVALVMLIRPTRSPEISVYDGQAWRTYTRDDGIKINSVVAAAADERGDLWFAGGAFGGGVNRFIAAQETYKHYSRQSKPEFSNDKPMYSNWVRDIAADGGVVWVATAVGLLRFEDEVWSAISISSGRPLFEVMDEICGGSSGCISSARNGGQETEAVWAVAAAGGNMWAAVDDGSLARWDGNQWTRIPAQEALGPEPKKGLKSYDRPINTLALSDGVLWAGTLNQGLLRYDGQDWRRFDESTGLPDDHVRDLEVAAGRVWVATEREAAWIDQDTGQVHLLPDIENARSIAVDAQRAYFATSSGLVALDLLDGERVTFDAETGLPHSSCLNVTLDHQGRVWVATQSSTPLSRHGILLLLLCPIVGIMLLLPVGYLIYRRRKLPTTTTPSQELADRFGAPQEDKSMGDHIRSSASWMFKLLIFLAIVWPAASALSDNLETVLLLLLFGPSLLRFAWEGAILLPAQRALKRGDYARAQRIVRIGLKLASRSTNLNTLQQEIYFRQGNFMDAVQCARRVIRLAPTMAASYSNLGGVLSHLSQYAEAEEVCQAALSLDARYPLAFNNLAWALVMHEEQLERAIALSHIALDLVRSREHRSTFTGTLTHAYLGMGKVSEALDKAQDALQLAQDASRDCHQLASRHYLLAMCQRAAAINDEARQNLQSALDLDPHGFYADKARRALREIS